MPVDLSAAPSPRQLLRRRGISATGGLLCLAIALALVAVPAAAVVRTAPAADLVRVMPPNTCTIDRAIDAGTAHVERPVYQVEPPSGGDHLDVPAAPANYGTRAPALGELVHSLEHGYVVLWAGTGIDDAGRHEIEQVRRRFTKDVIVVERPAVPSVVAATAWGVRLSCSAVDRDALTSFVQVFRNKGPERVPHG